MRKVYESAYRELAFWPDLSFVIERGKKHTRLFLEYEGKKEFILMGTSSSDRRADLNRIRDIRHAAKRLGAVRSDQ
jgi:hypothetical protein